MKKQVSLLALLLAFYAGYSGGQFHHGIGAGYLVNFAKGYGAASAVEVVYHPRITFVHAEKFSLGTGIPVGVGFQFGANPYGGVGGALLVDLPGMLDLNFGHGSSHENELSKLGGYVGGGFRYIFNYTFGGGSGITHIYGPGTHAGMRFFTGNDQSFGVGANYAYDINFRSHLIGIGFMYNFLQ